jgi:hypothetical protein
VRQEAKSKRADILASARAGGETFSDRKDALDRHCYSQISGRKKPTLPTVGLIPWKIFLSPAVTKDDIACLLQAKPKDLKRALN